MEEVKKENILFISLAAINDINDSNIYADLMREFVKNGHNVTIISPVERRANSKTQFIEGSNFQILRVKTLNIQKVSIFEKTLGIFLIDFQIKWAIKEHLSKRVFNLLIYATPPVTLVNTIRYLRQRDRLTTYLLLKDIFPQNAVDLNFINPNSLIYKYFRRKELELYKLSDRIGCMSEANVNYLLQHNPTISPSTVEVCPNSIEPKEVISMQDSKNQELRNRFGINKDALVFFYGGNLGKPQMIPFIIEVLKSNCDNKKYHFVIIGSGVDYDKLEKFFKNENPSNLTLISQLAKDEYDKLLNIGDIGLIFLDKRFTIPNYPSRLLSYMENSMPILAATDSVTDIGQIAELNNFGKYCLSGDLKAFNLLLDFFYTIEKKDLFQMGANSRNYLLANYTVSNAYNIISNIEIKTKI